MTYILLCIFRNIFSIVRKKFAARTNSPVFGATPQLLDKYQEDKHDIREPENSSCIVWLHKWVDTMISMMDEYR